MKHDEVNEFPFQSRLALVKDEEEHAEVNEVSTDVKEEENSDDVATRPELVHGDEDLNVAEEEEGGEVPSLEEALRRGNAAAGGSCRNEGTAY